MNPLVSIIIPTYNRAHLISETLESIIAQTYSNWECIIVDDGSTDNTDEIVNNYMLKDKRFQYHCRPIGKRKGPSSCRNYGYELSKGEYVNWFDSDDLYLPDALSSWINQFEKKTDVVVARVERIDSETRKKISENSILSNTIIEDYFVGKITYYVCGPLWRRRFLEQQTELFDESIRNLDDWDFNLRMLYQNPKIVYINRPLVQYRIHENSLSKEINKLNFEELKSEFHAREKQLKLIKETKETIPLVLQLYLKNRYKFILRDALVQKHKQRFYFFRILLKEEINLFDIIGVLRTVVGYVIYVLFNKGYTFFK